MNSTTALPVRKESAIPQLPESIMEAGGYAAVLASESSKLALQDALDATLQGRLVDVRNAFRRLHWEGPLNQKVLRKTVDGRTLIFTHEHEQVGAGRNVVSSTFIIKDVTDAANVRVLATELDGLMLSAEDFAAGVDRQALTALREPAPPKPAPLGAWAPQHRAVLQPLAIHPDVVDAMMGVGGYDAIMAEPAHVEKFGKILDSLWGRRIVDVRNSARELGFEGDQHAETLYKRAEGRLLAFCVEPQAAAPHNNCVGATFVIRDVTKPVSLETAPVLASHSDRLMFVAKDLMMGLNTSALEVIRGHAPAPVEKPAPKAPPSDLEPSEAMEQIRQLLSQAKGVWERIPESDRVDLCDVSYPDAHLGDVLNTAVKTADEVAESLSNGPRP
ncbi:hypothetical protein LJR168_003755 [Pseudoxanthomonas sp. LjRoot168]|uniref:hypothetical protein n=1 Tax=unclassified Pseudoxanthomonas TaxID=2645906 RepID=UPI003ED082C6